MAAEKRGPGGSLPGGPPRFWSTEQRMKTFWAKVDKTDTCWLWTGSKTTRGYGRVSWDRRTTGAHRVSYQALVGPIPEGLELDHLCRVKHCVNPDHLEPVTHSENVRRGVAARPPSERCRNGHLRTMENTEHNAAGWIQCRICLLERGKLAKRRARRAARALKEAN